MTSPAERLSEPVRAPTPLRLLVTAAATAAWYDADADEQAEVAGRLRELIATWLAQPSVTLVGSFDDDLLLAGDPRPFGRWSIFLLLDVSTLDAAVAMVDALRGGRPRLSRYFTLAATLGRPFWPAEDAR